MNYQSKKYKLLIADESYNSSINDIFNSTSFPGNISVRFSRGAKPLDSLKSDGDEIFPLVINDIKNNKTVAFGCCVVQKLFVNGIAENVGYLTGLKVLPEYQKKINIIPMAYDFLYNNLKSKVSLFYTTILSENYDVQKILEKKRKSMPDYNYIGNYTVHCFKGRKKLLNVNQGDIDGIESFYNKYSCKNNFSPVNINLYNLSNNDFFTMRDKKGNIVMACAVWNQQNYKQYIIDGYHGIFKILRHFPTNLMGYPKFPKPRSPIDYGTLSLFCCDKMYIDKIPDFLNTVSSMVPYSFLIYGVFENNPFCKYVEKLKSVTYSSKLYTVDWDRKFELNDNQVYLEVGLL